MDEPKCHFCDARPPDDLPEEQMIWGRKEKSGWYSNGLSDTCGSVQVKFYVCRLHFPRLMEAWFWAYEEFARLRGTEHGDKNVAS